MLISEYIVAAGGGCPEALSDDRAGRAPARIERACPQASQPVRRFNSSPEVIRLVV